MPDNKLISIIICQTDEDVCHGLVEELLKLSIPMGMKVDVQIIESKAGKLAEAYNMGMRASNAKYRFFIDESARFINKNLIQEVLDFLNEEKNGLVGLFGSEMPINGNFAESNRRFGYYAEYVTVEELNGTVTFGENPLWEQFVHCVDGRFIAVSKEIEWDESVGDDFAAAALCMRYRKAGFNCLVPMQDTPFMAFGRPSFYSMQGINPNFSVEAKKFFCKYWDIIQPLVSVLIPTYNQPVFFEKALQSALQQDYRNIEIVIGDDSTNDETKKLMEEKYIGKYPRIKYFHHGGPLGGHGLKNIEFILNHADGDFVNYLFHDDIFYTTKISRMVTCYEEDLEEKLGIVTSTRDAIDENDNVLGRANPWQPYGDTVLSAEQLIKGILLSGANFVGELTTVLLRKKFLQQGEKAKYRYLVSMYCGVLDTEYGDISTFLEMARHGHSCMFLKDTLSAFRQHGAQNSWKLDVILGGLMEWMDYLVLSWLNEVYISTEEERNRCFDSFCPGLSKMFNDVIKIHVGETMPEAYDWLCRIISAIERKEYESAVDMIISYMMKRTEDTSVLTRVCRRNEKGLWCKR